MSTSAQLPLCVYCGTARPADRSECPKCGRPWIDVRVGSLAEARTEVLVGAGATTETPNVSAIPVILEDDPNNATALTLDLTADDETDSPAPGFRRAIPIVLAVSATAVIAMFVLGLLDGEQTQDPSDLGAATTVLPQTTEAPVTTAQAPTTTTPPATTTIPTTTIPQPLEVRVWGDPLPVNSLRLTSGGLGPIEIGRPATEAVGQLVATFGAPEEILIAGEEYGLCADGDGRLVRWAELTVVVSGTIADGTFVGYRYEEPAVPTSLLGLATPSGVRLGDEIATLNEVYASFTLSYETVAGVSTFRLFENGELLLWGPVSSTEDSGRVEGIYSPPACGSG